MIAVIAALLPFPGGPVLPRLEWPEEHASGVTPTTITDERTGCVLMLDDGWDDGDDGDDDEPTLVMPRQHYEHASAVFERLLQEIKPEGES